MTCNSWTHKKGARLEPWSFISQSTCIFCMRPPVLQSSHIHIYAVYTYTLTKLTLYSLRGSQGKVAWQQNNFMNWHDGGPDPTPNEASVGIPPGLQVGVGSGHDKLLLRSLVLKQKVCCQAGKVRTSRGVGRLIECTSSLHSAWLFQLQKYTNSYCFLTPKNERLKERLV